MNFIRLMIFLLCFPVALKAQQETAVEEVKIHASTTVKSFYLGEAFSYTILVSGSDQVKAPDTSLINDFSIKLMSEGPLAHKDKKGYAIRYKLLAQRAGKLPLPALQVKVNGEFMETEALSLEVKAPKEHPGLKIEMHLSQTEAFVGEPILATFVLSSELPMYAFNAVDIKYPFIGHYGFRLFTPENAPISGVKNSIGIPVSNTRIIGTRSRLQEDGKNIDRLSFKRIIIPTVAGEMKLKPATFLASYTAPKVNNNKRNWQPQYPSHFNNNFFEEVEGKSYEKYFASSPGLTLKIKDLPVKGRPADFGGLVGKCNLALEVSPTAVEEGGPVNLKITVSDYEYPGLPELSDFNEQLAFNRNFAIPSRQSLGRVEGKSKVFLRTIRPLRTDVAAVPPIRVAYFDPQTESYSVAQTESVALTVTPAKSVTAFDADLSGGKILKNKVETSTRGIRHNSLDESMLKVNRKVSILLFFALFAAPVLYLLATLATSEMRLKMKDPVGARRKFAYKKFLSQFSATQDMRSLEKTVKSYFADHLNLIADAHVLGDLLPAFQPYEKELKELYERFDASRFQEADVDADFKKTKDDANRLIGTIQRGLKHA